MECTHCTVTGNGHYFNRRIYIVCWLRITSEDPNNALSQLLAFVVILHRCNGRLSSINALRVNDRTPTSTVGTCGQLSYNRKRNIWCETTGLRRRTRIGEKLNWIQSASDLQKMVLHVLQKVSFTINEGERKLPSLVLRVRANRHLIDVIVSGLYEPTSGTDFNRVELPQVPLRPKLMV